MTGIHSFRQVVFGGSYVAHVVSSTVDPAFNVQLCSGADYALEGALPSGRYLFLVERNAVKDRFGLFTLVVNKTSSELSNGFPWVTHWEFNSKDGTTSQTIWDDNKLILQPNAWNQLNAYENSWSAKFYLDELRNAVAEIVGFRPTDNVVASSPSDEVAKLSELLARLEHGDHAIEVLKSVSEQLRKRLVWQPKGCPEPVFGLVDSDNPAKTLGFQVSKILHGFLDQFEKVIGPISREGLIKRV